MARMWWHVLPPRSHAATRTPRPTSPTTSTTSSTNMRPRARQGNQLRYPKRRPPVKEFAKTQPPLVEKCIWSRRLLKNTTGQPTCIWSKWICGSMTGCIEWRTVDSHLIRTFQKISKSISILTPVLHYFFFKKVNGKN